MLQRIKRWWDWNDLNIIVFPVLGLIAATFIAGWLLLLGQAHTYKFNCNLDHRPDLHTTLFIADETYAYNPELFCNTLREKMHK